VTSRSAAAALALAATLAASPASAAERRLAILIGEPDGGAGTVPLRYAERDARRIREVLVRLGGVREEDARLLLSPGAADVRRALEELAERSRRARARGDRTVLLLYYSGHAKDGALRLRETRLELADLKRLLEQAPADVRIGFLDSCRSGAITRAKGVRRAPAFDVSRAAGPRGLVLVTSSGADEDSQESDAIGGSFFTHHLASGLLGDADASGDGKVTLAEAYAYAYARTVASTAESAAGVQHPAYLYDLGGAGDVVLTELPAAGALVFPASTEGTFVVLDRAHRAVAEVAKAAGAPRRLALPAGSYTVKKRLAAGDGLLVEDLDLATAPVEVDEARMMRVPLTKDPQKGFGGSRWSLLAGLGGQRFFGPSTASGLFPGVGLGGLELMVRDDLGHGLAWGLDAALGGGSSSLGFAGDPVAMRIAEVSGGGSLWKDFQAGPFTLSAGARLAFIYLTRSFPQRPDLPSQYFFTLTPGLTGAATWAFSERFAAVARVRGHYLFYNVDRNMSLGYAELLLGVEYAFGN
jgi:Caspase domain